MDQPTVQYIIYRMAFVLLWQSRATEPKVSSRGNAMSRATLPVLLSQPFVHL